MLKIQEYTCLDIVSSEGVDIVADAGNMPISNESFDTVICTQVLEHVKNPEKVVRECYRILKKQGVVVLTAPFIAPFHADPDDFFRYTPNGLQELFMRENFFVIEFGRIGSIWAVLSGFVKFSFFDPYKKPTKLKRAIFRRIESIFYLFDRHMIPGRIHSASYLIARKQ